MSTNGVGLSGVRMITQQHLRALVASGEADNIYYGPHRTSLAALFSDGRTKRETRPQSG